VKRHQAINITSALLTSVLALSSPPEVVAVTAAPCIVCGETCSNLLSWCNLEGCISDGAHGCNIPGADCTWDWDDNDDAIWCDGFAQ